MRTDGRECQPWCDTDHPAPPMAVVLNGNVFQYGKKVYCCPDKAFAAAGVHWERMPPTPRGFYGAGIGNLLDKVKP